MHKGQQKVEGDMIIAEPGQEKCNFIFQVVSEIETQMFDGEY